MYTTIHSLLYEKKNKQMMKNEKINIVSIFEN